MHQLAKYLAMRFKTWLEGWENYGFGKAPEPRPHAEPENPIDQFDIEQLHDFLVERKVGQLRPRSKFVNEVIWGEQVGAVRYWIGPGYQTIVDRLGRDLEGNLIWYTKKAFQINRAGFGGHERIVAQDMHEHLEAVYNREFDSPAPEYDRMKQLAVTMADKIRRTCRPIFMFNKIVEQAPHHYLICFEVRGQGVESMDHQKVEQMTIETFFDPRKGYIRAMLYPIESTVGRTRSWSIPPVQVDLNFFPTQSFDEIIEPLALYMRYY